MALKVELKPHERIIIGACVVTNTDQRARLLIEGIFFLLTGFHLTGNARAA